MVTRARLARWNLLLRYWALDKYHEQLRLAVLFLSALVAFALLVVLLQTLTGAADGAAMRADGGATIIIQIIMLVVSLAISYAMRPKVEPVKPQEGRIPQVEDGKAIRRLYGSDWFDDSSILGWKNLGTDAIKSGGGKKWTPGLLPGTTNPIESWLDDRWNVSGLNDVDDPLGGGNHYPPEGGGDFDPDEF